MELYVAKSYQGLPVVEEPYKKGGKTYCKVRTPKGVLKEVFHNFTDKVRKLFKYYFYKIMKE